MAYFRRVVATVTAGGAAFEYSSSVAAAPITAIAEAAGAACGLLRVGGRSPFRGIARLCLGRIRGRWFCWAEGRPLTDGAASLRSVPPFVTVHLLGTRVSMRYMDGGITYVKLLEGTVSINTRAPWGNYLSLSFGRHFGGFEGGDCSGRGGTPQTVVPPPSPVQVAVYSGAWRFRAG